MAAENCGRAGRKNAENEVLTAFTVRRGLKSFCGLAVRHHFQRFCDWMEHAPITLCQRHGTRRALHSGRAHPCLHYGHGLRLHGAGTKAGITGRETSFAVCHTKTRFFSALDVVPAIAPAPCGLRPSPPFRQGSAAFLRVLRCALNTIEPHSATHRGERWQGMATLRLRRARLGQKGKSKGEETRLADKSCKASFRFSPSLSHFLFCS